MGFVAVFAGAANTPIASTLMAVELFGAEAGAYAGIACVVSYLFSGHTGIYHAQRVGRSKHPGSTAEEGLSLAMVVKAREVDEAMLLDTVNAVGYIGGDAMEEDLTILRLYFSSSEMRKSDAWWKRFAPQNLGPYLLEQAKEHGIEQALLHRVIGGYLNNQDLAMDTGEIPSSRLPQCLELVGEEADLQAFLRDNSTHLMNVRKVFLRGQDAIVEAAIERSEIEQALEMEQSDNFRSSSKDD
jgi:PII-like signaling protein